MLKNSQENKNGKCIDVLKKKYIKKTLDLMIDNTRAGIKESSIPP